MAQIIPLETDKPHNEGQKPSADTDAQISFDINSYIPFLLVVSQLKMHNVVRPESHPDVTALESLSKGDCRILVLVASQTNISPSMVAETLAMDPAVITRLLASLSKKKLIETKRDESDLRRKSICLTKRGEKVAGILIGIMSDFGKYVDDSITENEKRKLIKILSKLNLGCENFPA